MAYALLLLFFASTVLADNFFTVTLKTDANSRYVVPADMGPLSASQSFDFALSMGTPYLSVVGTSCTTCNGSLAYDQTKSTTAKSLTGSANISLIGGGTTSGALITEDCRLPVNNGSSWSYPNQTIVVASSSNDLFNNKVNGIFGLQTDSGDAAMINTSVIGGVFGRNPSQSSFTYGMALQPPSASSSSAGQLHWFAPDNSSFTGTVIMKNATALTSPAISGGGPGSQTTVFDLDGWTVSVPGGNNVQSTLQNLQAALDPYYPDIYFPTNQANLIYAAIPGASSSPGDNGQSTVWTIPCGTKFSFSSTIGGRSFSLDQSQLIQTNSDGTCSSYIRGWTNTTVELYLFGSSFISSLYLIVEVANPSSGQPGQIGFAMRSGNSSSSTPVGAIVGGVIGGIVVLAIIAIAIFFIVRRSKNQDGFGLGTYVPGPKVEPFNVNSSQPPSGRIDQHNISGSQSPTVHVPLLPPSYQH